MKSIILSRVSSKEQEETGYSLDAQMNLLKDYASKNEFEVAKMFRIAESATGKQVRKLFHEMMAFTENNKIPIILCEKIDRLTRNMKDAVMVDDWLAQDERREVHFVKESFIVNKNSRAHEKFIWDMKVAVARLYANNLSEEVKKGQAEKIAQGGYPGQAPVGYKATGEKGHRAHIVDDNKAPFMIRMFELYATGNYSVKAIVQTMNKEGLRNYLGKPISETRTNEYLRDPFYYGSFMWKGKLYKGTHEPLISKELFDQVQEKLNRGTKQPQYRKHLPVFKAKITCEECTGVITWEIQKGHWYGRCNHHRECSQHRCIRQEKVEEQLFPYFDKVAPTNPRVIEWLKKALKESHAKEIEYNATHRAELTKRLDIFQKRLEALYEDKLDKTITSEFYEKKSSEYTTEKEQICNDLKKLNEENTAYYEAGYAIHELACKAQEIYLSPKTTNEEKRLLLSYIFSNLSLKERTIAPNYTLAFEFLAKWVPIINNIFEPQKIGYTKEKEDTFMSSHPVLLEGRGSNP